MKYEKFIEKVLGGSSVNARAKELGIQQTTLNNYKLGKRIPSCAMTLKLAKAAGVSIEEAVKAVAEKEINTHTVQASSLRRPALFSVLLGLLCVNLFLTPSPAQAAPVLGIIYIM